MIYDCLGRRKYLTQHERRLFLRAAENADPDVKTFCFVLAHLGARVSEVLALTPQSIDRSAGYVLIESLKKRRRGVYRAVPACEELFQVLEEVHGIASRMENAKSLGERIWPWCRTTAWSNVKGVMLLAGIPEDLAMPKALRHAFGVQATAEARIPLNMVRKWMGHARIETTAIYADAVGTEERRLLASIWES